MGTEVIKSFGTLQAELELAKNNLKGLDENIKRIIGREPTDGPPRLNNKRSGNGIPAEDPHRLNRNERVGGYGPRNQQQNQPDHPEWRQDINNSNNKKHPKEARSVFSRLSGPPKLYPEEYNPEYVPDPNDYHSPERQKPKMQSSVFRELPSRESVLAAQGGDEKSKARSRRIFGSLLGTLQKFKQDETRLKPQDEKKAQILKKVEDQAQRELEQIKKTRQDLFMDRKRKQAEIRAIELKMHRMQEYTKWEECQKPLFNFIVTKAKPNLYYKPKAMNQKMEENLRVSREKLEKSIDKKRQEVFEELQLIEQSALNHVEQNGRKNQWIGNRARENHVTNQEDVEMDVKDENSRNGDQNENRRKERKRRHEERDIKENLAATGVTLDLSVDDSNPSIKEEDAHSASEEEEGEIVNECKKKKERPISVEKQEQLVQQITISEIPEPEEIDPNDRTVEKIVIAENPENKENHENSNQEILA